MKIVGAIRRWLLYTTSLLGSLLLAVTFLPILPLWIHLLTGPWTDSGGDIMIVLGGDFTAGHILGLSSYWRSVYAVYEWRAGHFQQIVVSGGLGVAESMRDFMVAQGVPASAIRLETRSQTTRDQALNVTNMLRSASGAKVLLTSDYHSLRAYRAFHQSGLDTISRPVPDAGKRVGALTARWNIAIELLQETIKLMWYRAHGWA